MWLQRTKNAVITSLLVVSTCSHIQNVVGSTHISDRRSFERSVDKNWADANDKRAKMIENILSKARSMEADYFAAGVNDMTTDFLASGYRRRLADDDAGGDDYQKFDLTGYSLKYAKCQPVQRFSEEAVKNGEYSSLVKENLVVFRLCPDRQCSADSEYGCSSGYGEYVIPLQDYLATMIQYQATKKENMCAFCAECSDKGYGYNGRKNFRRGRALDGEGGNDAEEEGGDESEEGEDGGEGEEDQAEEEEDAQNEEAEEEENADEEAAEGQEEQEVEQEENAYEANYYDDAAYDDAVADDGDGNDAYDADDFYNNGEDNANGDEGGEDADGNDDDISDLCQSYYQACNGYQNKYCGDGDDNDDGANIDYSDYLYCMKVDGTSYYISPYCDTEENSILMGIFYDPYCTQYAGNQLSINDITGLAFQKNPFAEFYQGECVSCEPNEEGPSYNIESDMCNELYHESAKCNTYMAYDLGDDEDDSDATCAYVESIRFGTYDSNGNFATSNGSMPSKVTVSQIGLLVLTSLFCLGFAFYSCFLHHEITNVLLKQLSTRGRLLPGTRRGKSSYLTSDDETPAASATTSGSYTSGEESNYVLT